MFFCMSEEQQCSLPSSWKTFKEENMSLRVSFVLDDTSKWYVGIQYAVALLQLLFRTRLEGKVMLRNRSSTPQMLASTES